MRGPSGGLLATGGASLVIDSIATGETLTESLRTIRPGGSLLVVALPSFPEKVDWSPIVFKEIRVTGSFLYGNETFEGKHRPTFAHAIDLLRTRRTDLRTIAPRLFSLADYPAALAAAVDKKSSAVKVAFTF